VLGLTATTTTTINDTKKNATETCDKGDATTVGAEVACSIK
jgi:hypothetical protein